MPRNLNTIGVKIPFATSSKRKSIDRNGEPALTDENVTEIRKIMNFFAKVAISANATGTNTPERFIDLLNIPAK